MTVVVGTTLTTFAMQDPHAWGSWLRNAERQRAMAEAEGHELVHFAAIETDARGIEPFADLVNAIDSLGGDWWTYTLDDGRTKVDMGGSRWRHITMGQNIVTEYCQSRPDVDWLLFLAADCAAPSDIVPRMLEMQHPLCAPYITTYGLRGPLAVWPHIKRDDGDDWAVNRRQPYPAEWGVEAAMASAAAIWIGRDVFRRIRWRWDHDAQMSDDPCFHHDALHLLGLPTHVRHDVLAKHYPEAVGDYESRGYDTTVVR